MEDRYLIEYKEYDDRIVLCGIRKSALPYPFLGTKHFTCVGNNLHLPSEINGKPVVKLRTSA